MRMSFALFAAILIVSLVFVSGCDMAGCEGCECEGCGGCEKVTKEVKEDEKTTAGTAPATPNQNQQPAT